MISRNCLRIMLVLVCLSFFPLLSYSKIHFKDVTSKFMVKGYDYWGGHGISWGDVNGDGRLDFYVKNVGAWGPGKTRLLVVDNILYINYGGYFLDEAILRGVADGYELGTHGAVFANLDNDEDLDLFSTTTYNTSPARNHIYRNDGNGFFTDITSGIIPPQKRNVSARGVAAADFDGDGDIDLYFSNGLGNTDPFNPNPFPPKRLKNFYINNGDGTFTPRYRGISWTGFTQGVVAVDIDDDGDIDIAEAKWNAPSTVYLNDGKGKFNDAGEELGLPSTLGVWENGMTFGDVNNDGDMDLAIIGSGRVELYENTGGSLILYQTINTSRGPADFHVCFGDFDHDTDLDLYISGGNVHENDGQGIFSLVLPEKSGLESSLNTEDPRGSALGDFDNDGDLDIYISNVDGYNVLMRNTLNDSNWIQVEVMDGTGVARGIGTKLDLYVAGYLNQRKFLVGHREIHGEYGYLGQDMPTVHFGAPVSDNYDLKVTFFDGKKKILRNITPGQKIQVTYPFPSIGVDKTSLSFQGTEGGSNPDPQMVKIRNAGDKSLKYKICKNRDWLFIYPKKGSSKGEWDEIKVSVDISGLEEGNYEGIIKIKSSQASNSPVKIKVNLIIASPDLYAPLNFLGFRR